MSKKLLSLAALVALCLSAGYFALAGKAKAPGEPQEAVVASSGTSTWDRFPVNLGADDPATQMLYTAEQLQAATGGVDGYQITKLVFPFSCDWEGSADITIYASPTTKTALPKAEAVSITNQTKVFERNNFYVSGDMSFTLDTPIQLKKGQGVILTLCFSNIDELEGYGYYAATEANQALRAYPFDQSNPSTASWSVSQQNSRYVVPALNIEFEEVEVTGGDDPVTNDPIKATVLAQQGTQNGKESPVNLYDNASASQTIYDASLLEAATDGADNYEINKLYYTVAYSGYWSNVNPSFKIYAGPTDRVDFEDNAPISIDDLTLVYDATKTIGMSNPAANQQLEFALSTPIKMQKGQNLAVFMIANGNVASDKGMTFKDGVNFEPKVLYQSSSDANFDFTTATTGWTNSSTIRKIAALDIEYVVTEGGGEDPTPELTFPESFDVTFNVDGLEVVSQGMAEDGEDAGCYVINVAGTIAESTFNVTLATPEGWDGYYSVNYNDAFGYRRQAPSMSSVEGLLSWCTGAANSNSVTFTAGEGAGWYFLNKGDEICEDPFVVVRTNVETSVPAPEFPETFGVTTTPEGLDVSQAIDQEVYTITVNGETTEETVTVTLDVPEGWDGFIGMSDYDMAQGNIDPLKRLAARALEAEWYPIEDALNQGFKKTNTYTFATGEDQNASVWLYKGDVFDANNMISVEVRVTKKADDPVTNDPIKATVLAQAGSQNGKESPVNLYENSSASQTIYDASLLEAATDGADYYDITKLTYGVAYNGYWDNGNPAFKIYAGPTDRVDFADNAPISIDDLTLVYSDNKSITPYNYSAGSTFDFELSTPIHMKKGQNLVVFVIANDNTAGDKGMTFKDGVNFEPKVLYQSNSNASFDYTTANTGWTNSSAIRKIAALDIEYVVTEGGGDEPGPDEPGDDEITKLVTGELLSPNSIWSYNGTMAYTATACGPVDVQVPVYSDFCLYTKEMLGLQPAEGEEFVNINKLTYNYTYSGTEVANIPLQIYMQNTTAATIPGTDPANRYEQMTKVFDGTVSVNNGSGKLEIALDQSFKYDPNQNLYIRFYKQSDIADKGIIEFENFKVGSQSAFYQIIRYSSYSDSNAFEIGTGGNKYIAGLPVVEITCGKETTTPPEPEITFPESFNVTFDVEGLEVVSQGMVEEGDDAGCYVINVAGTIAESTFTVTLATPEGWDGYYSVNYNDAFGYRRQAPSMSSVEGLLEWCTGAVKSNSVAFVTGEGTGWYFLNKGDEICDEPFIVVRTNVESSVPAPEFPETFAVTTTPEGLDVNQLIEMDTYTIKVNGETKDELVTVTLDVPEGWDGFIGMSDYDMAQGDVDPLKRLAARALEAEWYPIEVLEQMGFKKSNTYTFATGEDQNAQVYLYKGDVFDSNNMISVEVRVAKKADKPVVVTEVSKTITGKIAVPQDPIWGGAFTSEAAGPLGVKDIHFADYCLYTSDMLGLEALPGQSTVNIKKLSYNYYYEGDDITNIPVQVRMMNTTKSSFAATESVDNYQAMQLVFDGTVNITPDSNGNGTLEFVLDGDGFDYDPSMNLYIRFDKNDETAAGKGLIEYKNFDAGANRQIVRSNPNKSTFELGGGSVLGTLPVVTVTYLGEGEGPVVGDDTTTKVITGEIVENPESEGGVVMTDAGIMSLRPNYYAWQGIYTAAQLAIAPVDGETMVSVTEVAFPYSFSGTAAQNDLGIKVYMANVDKDVFKNNSDVIDTDDMTLVYDGTVSIEPGDNKISLGLIEAFQYDPTKNLAICAIKDNTVRVSGLSYPQFATDDTQVGYWFQNTSAFSDTFTSRMYTLPVMEISFIGKEGETPNPPVVGDEKTVTVSGDLIQYPVDEFGSQQFYCQPISTYYNPYAFQSVYRADQIGITDMAAAKISKLTYIYNEVNKAFSGVPVKIYMGNTDYETIGSYDWVPESAMTLVYDGTVDLVEGGNQNLDIELQTPFNYETGKNLAIMFVQEGNPYTFEWGLTFQFFGVDAKQSNSKDNNDAFTGTGNTALKCLPVVTMTYTEGQGSEDPGDDVLPDDLAYDERVITSDDVTTTAPGDFPISYATRMGITTFFYPGFAQQSIYSAAQMGLDAYDYAYITELTYPYNNENELELSGDIKMYMAQVDYTNYGDGGALDPADMKLVFDGTIDLAKGPGNLNIVLDNFFKYDTSKNLVIYAVKTGGDAYQYMSTGFQFIPTGEKSFAFGSSMSGATEDITCDMFANGNLAMTVKYGHEAPLPVYDLQAETITGETKPVVDETYTYTVAVKNLSNVAVEGFKVEVCNVIQGYAPIVMQELTVDEPLAAGEIGEYKLDVRFAATGEYNIMGRVIAPEGIEESRPGNNETDYLKVNVKNATFLTGESISGPATAVVGETGKFTVTVKNNGTTAMSDYAVNLVNVDGDNIRVLASASEVPTIEAGATATVEISYNFALAGKFNIAGQIVEDGETTLTPTAEVVVSYTHWPNATQLTTPSGVGEEGGSYYAINGYNNNSASQVMYLPEWLGDITRTAQIQKIKMNLQSPADANYNFTWPEVRISMACVDRTTGYEGNAGTDLVAEDEFTEVYRGPLTCYGGMESVEFELQSDFVYEPGKTLVVNFATTGENNSPMLFFASEYIEDARYIKYTFNTNAVDPDFSIYGASRYFSTNYVPVLDLTYALEPLPGVKDMKAVSLAAPEEVYAGEDTRLTVNVENAGTVEVDEFKIEIVDMTNLSDVKVIATKTVDEPYAPMTKGTEYVYVDFAEAGTYNLAARIICDGDQDMTNNLTTSIEVTVAEAVAKVDFAAEQISGPENADKDKAYEYVVTVKNEGDLMPESLKVLIMTAEGSTLASKDILGNEIPAAGATADVTLSVTFGELGTVDIFGKVEAEGDANDANDETDTITVTVSDSGVTSLFADGTVGFDAASGILSVRDARAVTVADIAGRLVLNQPVNGNAEFSLDLRNGIYVVSVIKLDGKTQSVKIRVK